MAEEEKLNPADELIFFLDSSSLFKAEEVYQSNRLQLRIHTVSEQELIFQISGVDAALLAKIDPELLILRLSDAVKDSIETTENALLLFNYCLRVLSEFGNVEKLISLICDQLELQPDQYESALETATLLDEFERAKDWLLKAKMYCANSHAPMTAGYFKSWYYLKHLHARISSIRQRLTEVISKLLRN